jgi:nitrite reductase/ring-hydroxylating ferredoxin subunit
VVARRPEALTGRLAPAGITPPPQGLKHIGHDHRCNPRAHSVSSGGHRARGFLPVNRDDRVFVVRRGERIHAYVNSCPHNWRPLDYAQDQFLSASGSEIVCYAHGAHFSIDSGECIAGVCMGQFLIPVPARVDNGMILIPRELPQPPE